MSVLGPAGEGLPGGPQGQPELPGVIRALSLPQASHSVISGLTGPAVREMEPLPCPVSLGTRTHS